MTKHKTNGQTLKLLWETSRPYAWRRNILLVISSVNFIVGMFVLPLIIAKFLDLIQSGNLQDSQAWWLIGAYTLAQLWSEVIGWRIVLYLVWTFETAMQRDLYQRIFSKLSTETMFFHSNRFGGSLVSQSNKLSGSVERFWDNIVWAALPVVISVVGSVVVLWFIYWQYALFLAILSVSFALVVYYGSRHMAKLNEIEAEASNKISGYLADAVSNILAVKTTATEGRELDLFTSKVKDWRGASLSTMRSFLKASTVYSSISATIRIGALVFAIIATRQDAVPVSVIFLIISYTSTVAHNLWNMNGIMRNYNRIMGDSKEMTTILNGKISITDQSRQKMVVSRGRISFNNLTFTHDEGQGATLFNDLSLEIKPGEKVGLVGLSGSGKTTLTKLLLRLADVDSGNILIDDQSIAEVSQESLRQNIAYVPQEPLLFHRSVGENISYAKPGATDQEIISAAKKAGAHSFIQELTDGYDTVVGERGVKLSGGQRQRVAIARAILKDAPILVLDEATSALDSESEKLIQKSLETLMKNRTSLVIAHRLSTITRLDRVIVLDEGKIIEDGTHDELIAQKGVYANLWLHQSGGFINES